MNNLRKRLLKSKAFFIPIFMAGAFAVTYMLSSLLGKAKPIEKFYIFISGAEFNTTVLKERINSFRTEKYEYLLDFETKLVDVDDESAYQSYDYRFENEAVSDCDLIIYTDTFFETNYPENAYSGHFAKIESPETSWVMKNEYAVQIHDKADAVKDEEIGITFTEDNYYISINKNTVHNSDRSDAARHFIEAFIHG